MRPVNRRSVPTDKDGNDITFGHYRDARDSLIERIGDYCSYCEVCLHVAIHVEHVRPKDPNPKLERVWSNFLLACEHCNSTKGDEDVVLLDYFWPDADNTARAFEYWPDEPPRVANALNAQHKQIAENTIKLTGLHRVPGVKDYSDRDRRWFKRKEAWGVALIARTALDKNPSEELRTFIVQTAISRGFWSVWMAVFHDDVEMRRRFLNWFPGTAVGECFDADTNPVPRPQGQI
jgi:uncharacterized protein (TIGR02646 family)